MEETCGYAFKFQRFQQNNPSLTSHKRGFDRAMAPQSFPCLCGDGQREIGCTFPGEGSTTCNQNSRLPGKEGKTEEERA